MTTIKISPRTWQDVKDEQKKLRLAFARMLERERATGKSSRQLAEEYGLSHVTVINLIQELQDGQKLHPRAS